MNDCEKLYNRQYGTERPQLTYKDITTFGWTVPNDLAIDTCVAYNPLVEIGAGLGYWAKLIRNKGGIIYTYDSNKSLPVKEGFPPDILLHPEANLFICYPPFGGDMASDCVRIFEGKYIIYVGEGPKGLSGSHQFPTKLSTEFDEIKRVAIPNWLGLSDDLTVWERK